MKKRTKEIATVVVMMIAILVMAGAAMRAKVRAERDRDVAVANVEAAQTKQIRIEADGRAAVLRLQLQHNADSMAQLVLGGTISAALRELDDSLGIVVKALSGLQVEFQARMTEFDQALVEMADAVTPQGDTVRIAAFQEEGPPVEGEMVVEVPKDPNRPIMLTTVLRPTPWQATLQLGCTDRHVASFALDVPDWVPAEIALGVVDQDVCNPLPDISFAADLFRIDAPKVVWAGLGGLAVFLIMAAAR